MTNLEQTVLDRFRKLSVEKQGDVLEFLNLIEQDFSNKSTDAEREEAKRILEVAKQKAMSNSPKSAQELWSDFHEAKRTIADEYELKND